MSKVSDLKNLLMRELDIDDGIDIVLKESQKNGKRIRTIQKLKQACNKGAITVEFVESGPSNRNRNRATRAPQIAEEDDGYSDQSFEKEEQPVQGKTQPGVSKDATIQQMLSDIRFYLMIKRVPFTHMARYLQAEGDVTTEDLSGVLATRFPFNRTQCNKLARYLVEPHSSEVELKNHSIERQEFIQRLRSEIPQYGLFNGLAITSMLGRLHQIVSDRDTIAELNEDLNLEDEDATGEIKWSVIQKVWKINQIPELDDEMSEFLQFLGMRNSEGSDKIYIQKFIDIFSEDYLIEPSHHEDPQPFDESQAADDADLQTQPPA